jgi:hypothetical protein
MRTEVSIEIKTLTSILTVDMDYRPWTSDPDLWELHVPKTIGVMSSGDWLSDGPSREVRFRTDILSLATGAKSHDVVLILSMRYRNLPGTNPFFRGQTGFGKTGPVSSIHSSTPPGVGVGWKVIKGPPPP